jgi:MFS family permease
MHAPQAKSKPRASQIAVLATGATIGNMLGITPTVAATFGTFLVPVAQEFNWSRTAVAGGFTAMSLATAATFPITGRLADRYGTRPVLLIGFLLLGLAIVALSAAPPTVLGFYALFALTGAVGSLPSTMVLSKLISEWLEESRGFWMGLTGGIGNGLGSTIMPIVAATLLATHGWRGSLAIIGGIVLLVGLPVAWFTLRPPPAIAAAEHEEDVLPGMTAGQAFRTPMLWLILSSVALGGGALTGVFSTTVPILIARGLTLAQATGVIVAFAMICTLWEPLVGWLLDRSDRPRAVAPFYLCAALGLVAMTQAHGAGMLTLSGVLTGIGLGSEFSVLPYVLSRYFGLRAMGTITGVAYTVVLSANAIVPVLLNFAFDRLGTYAPMLWIVAAMLLYNALLFVWIKPYPAGFEGESARA